MLSVKLLHLDSWSAKRRQNAETYTKFFIEAGLAEGTGRTAFNKTNKVLLPKAVYQSSGVKNYHIYNQFIIRTEDRDGLKKYLTENNIGTEIYYPVPFHLQECFANLGYQKGDFPNSEFDANTSLALPIYPELTEEQLKYVVEEIKMYLSQEV